MEKKLNVFIPRNALLNNGEFVERKPKLWQHLMGTPVFRQPQQTLAL